ncbi:hypothetical protein [Rhodococcus opacus]|uniref:hypothetical protein n=1 Tax=Rhodococcus opacus TaxID=37919 RepID=UPI002475F457|nr:hypothetical protein [Rhodococcus opacus]
MRTLGLLGRHRQAIGRPKVAALAWYSNGFVVHTKFMISDLLVHPAAAPVEMRIEHFELLLP